MRRASRCSSKRSTTSTCPGTGRTRSMPRRTSCRPSSSPNVRLQLDQYHAAMAGQDALDCLRRYFPLIAHVQIADVPGRHEPGTGTQPIAAFLRELDRLGYDGFVGLEYRPLVDTASSLRLDPRDGSARSRTRRSRAAALGRLLRRPAQQRPRVTHRVEAADRSRQGSAARLNSSGSGSRTVPAMAMHGIPRVAP